MDPITLDLILTIIASTALIGSSSVALCLLPRNDAEVVQLSRALGWGAASRKAPQPAGLPEAPRAARKPERLAAPQGRLIAA